MKSLLAFFLSAVIANAAVTEKGKPVENGASAIAVAEAALRAKFGERSVKGQRPFRVRFVKHEPEKEDVWVVEGKAPEIPGQFGGVMMAIVAKKDGRVLDAFMQK